jgi:hypothetical protein
MQQRYRTGWSSGNFVGETYRGRQQYLAGARPPAQLSGEMDGIAHEGNRGMFRETECPYRNFSPVEPDADAGIERMPLLPGCLDRSKTLLNHACRSHRFVDIRVARIANAESSHLVGLTQPKDLPAAFQDGASYQRKKFSQQRSDYGWGQLLSDRVESVQGRTQHCRTRRLGADGPC